eukprot:m.82157 g.82157  ORF g.82157 m.82157 type:complete len:659 (+) comp12674_c0_seq2:186-2162(+)
MAATRDQAAAEMRLRAEEELRADEAKLEYYTGQFTTLAGAIQHMEALLFKFEQRIDNIQETIAPVHQETDTVSTSRANYEEALQKLKAVEEYYTLASRVKNEIERGPAYQLEAYLLRLGEVKKGIDYFNQNNPQNAQHDLLRTLWERGCELLAVEFDTLFQRHSLGHTEDHMEALIADTKGVIDAEIPAWKCEEPTIHFDSDILRTLNRILEWLTINNCKERAVHCIDLLVKNRTSVILQAIESLADPSSSSSSSLRRDQSKSTRHRFRASLSFGKSLEAAIDTAYEPVHDAYNRGSEPILEYSLALLACIRYEHALISKVMPKSQYRAPLARLLAEPMRQFVLHLQELPKRAMQRAQTEQFFSCLFILDCLEVFEKQRPYFEHVTGECDENTRRAIHEAVFDLCASSRHVLLQFQQFVNSSSTKTLPEDGTILELTAHTMKFLNTLEDYQIGTTMAISGVQPFQQRTTAKVGEWQRSVLDALHGNLERKSSTAEHPALGSMFLVNNLNYISLKLGNPVFAAFLSEGLQEVQEQYRAAVVSAKRNYLSTTWSPILDYLQTEPFSQPLSKREREVIKERFAAFNDNFTRIQTQQQSFAVANEVLRDELRNANIEIVVPKYTAFYEHYKDAKFSLKNPQKYLRFTPSDVHHSIMAFFGAI